MIMSTHKFSTSCHCYPDIAHEQRAVNMYVLLSLDIMHMTIICRIHIDVHGH